MLGFDRQLESRATEAARLLRAPALGEGRSGPSESKSDSKLVCSRLADGVLHDLRSPLMAISGFAEVLALRHSPELGPDARRCLENIVGATRRLEQMVELLAGYARLGSGELERRPLGLGELLRGLGAGVSGSAQPLLSGDESVLREAFAVLLQQAQRGQRVEEVVGTQIEDLGGRVRVSIALREEPPAADLEVELARRALERHGGSLRLERRARGELGFVVELPVLGAR